MVLVAAVTNVGTTYLWGPTGVGLEISCFSSPTKVTLNAGTSIDADYPTNRYVDILGIKREITGFWAGVAEGAAPAVQKILDWLRKIDLTSIGQQIGATMGAIMEALKSGEITILITDSFDAAFEQIGNNAARLFNGIFAMLLTRLTQLALEIPDQFNVIAPAITGLLISTGPSKIFIPTAALWSVAEANDPAFIPPPPSPAKASRRPSQ